MAELMNQGSTVRARPERQDDVSVTDLGELMTFLGETPDVIPQGFTLLLLAILQVPRVARPYVCALKVASDYLLEILPVVDRVSGQVIEPGPGRVSQVNGEELDDEKIVIYPAREAVVLQPNARICFVIIFDNIIRCLKAFREACVAHVAPKQFRPWPFRAKAMPFLIIATQIARAVFRMCPSSPL
jgi:hypothetical protein